jgi:hypothetical protein
VTHERPSGDPAQIDYFVTVFLLFILVVYVTMVYGPIAAWLVEMFPTRIRYSGLSLPYPHRQWLVRRLPAATRCSPSSRRPAISTRASGIRGNSYRELLCRLLFLPETKDVGITKNAISSGACHALGFLGRGLFCRQ